MGFIEMGDATRKALERPLMFSEETMKALERPLAFSEETMKLLERPLGISKETWKLLERPLGLSAETWKALERPLALSEETWKALERPLMFSEETMKALERPLLSEETWKLLEQPLGVSPETWKTLGESMSTITASEMRGLSRLAVEDLSDAGSDSDAVSLLEQELSTLDESEPLSNWLPTLGSMRQRAVLILSLSALVQVVHYANAEAGVDEPPHLFLLLQALLTFVLALNMCVGDR